MCPLDPSDPARDPAEVLHAEDRWLERHALRLTRDPEAAAEAVQETWLAALQSGPRYGANLRGWLARVAQNAVRKARRSARHRADREHAYGAAKGDGRSATDLGRDVRLRLDLEDAVASLAPDVRRALVLRYVHGLTLREVGRELRLPLSTVDDRLRRGLSELRRRLGTERWASALIGLARPSRTSAVGAQAPRVALALAAVGVLGAALALGSPWPGPSPRGESAPAVASPQGPSVSLVGAAPRGARVERGAATEAPLPPRSTGALVVVVLDPSGAPLADVYVRPSPQETGRRGAFPPGLRTDERGLAAWRDLAPGRYELRADRFLVPFVEVGAGHETRVARRLSGPPLRGVVVDPDGRPVPGAEVWLSPSPAGALHEGRWVTEPVDAEATLTTDADGRFAFATRGEARRLGARAVGFAPSPGRRIGPVTDAGEGLVLTLGGPGGAIDGRVVDAAGRPVAGAAVTVACLERATSDVAWLALTDAEGAFAFDGLEPGPCRVVVDALGRPPWQRDVALAPGRALGLDARLLEARALSGRVVEPDGRPAPGAWVTSVTASGGDRAAHDLRRTVRAADDGAFELEGSAPGAPLFEVRDGQGPRELSRVTRADNGALELVLSRPRRVTGRVVDEAGHPITACVVQAQGARPWEAITASLDEAGRFTLDLPSDAPGALTVVERGFPVHTVEGAEGHELTIVLADRARPNARVRGRVATPLGVALAAVRLEFADRRTGQVHGHEVELTDGRFVSDPVPPGDYRVSLKARDAASDVDVDVHLTPHAEVSLATLALAPTIACEWSIDLAAPARGLCSAVRRADGALVHAARLDDGVGAVPLRLRLLPGDYTWVVWSATTLPRARALRVAAPGSTERLALEPGEPCALVLRRPEGAPPTSALSIALLQGEAWVPFELHPSFREVGAPFVLEVGLAPGPQRLSVVRAEDPRDPARDLCFDVTPGAALPRRIELPLPRGFGGCDRKLGPARD